MKEILGIKGKIARAGYTGNLIAWNKEVMPISFDQPLSGNLPSIARIIIIPNELPLCRELIFFFFF
jgi:hypothetical protein